MGEPTAAVLAADDGEHLLNASGEVVVKLDPGQGSKHLAFGTQLVPPGAGIPRHVHAHWDEFIYVLDGSGTATLNDQRVPIQKGATIFIPTGTWHGFENPGTELFILWATTLTGQEEFFRGISSRPGEPAKNLTPDQVLAIRQQVEADHLKRREQSCADPRIEGEAAHRDEWGSRRTVPFNERRRFSSELTAPSATEVRAIARTIRVAGGCCIIAPLGSSKMASFSLAGYHAIGVGFNAAIRGSGRDRTTRCAARE